MKLNVRNCTSDQFNNLIIRDHYKYSYYSFAHSLNQYLLGVFFFYLLLLNKALGAKIHALREFTIY